MGDRSAAPYLSSSIPAGGAFVSLFSLEKSDEQNSLRGMDWKIKKRI